MNNISITPARHRRPWNRTQFTPHTKVEFYIWCDSCFCPTLLECVSYTPRRWPFKGCNMLGLRKVL